MNDMLLDELELLQYEYRDLLVNAIENWDESNTIAVLDEISVFWQKNRRLVNCTLSYISAPYRSYMFTGATIFGIDDNEHYPFLCLGDFHIWDDPIYSYIKTALNSPNEIFNEQLTAQVKETIADNIKLIDTLKGKVFILPVRMLSETSIDLIHQAAMNAFLSIFKDELSFDDYKKNFKTIDDIIPALDENSSQLLIFDTGSNLKLDLKTRFTDYRHTANLPLPSNASDATVFWFGIYGCLAQAIDILSVCTQYKLVPYIRYTVSFQYMLILAGNFRDNPEISQMLFQCVVAHALYHSFNTETYAHIPIDDMCKALRSANFEQQLFKLLNDSHISLDSPNLSITSEIIQQELARCLS